ncbi:hypothetical protein C1E24_06690 [Pseudoalteromonas phenolica]|uniref:Uncharacterized protein n=2 Tax=Pseudoalteromonas phenolica TaxID=161398 RepID=A0A5R9Q432_9GAMM|nr:hypothetical protein C1E24_06690 [Pseudoalteromonas phenolica]
MLIYEYSPMNSNPMSQQYNGLEAQPSDDLQKLNLSAALTSLIRKQNNGGDYWLLQNLIDDDE